MVLMSLEEYPFSTGVVENYELRNNYLIWNEICYINAYKAIAKRFLLL